MNNVNRVSLLSKAAFYKDYLQEQKPVIITDLINKWQGFELWSLDYFEQKYGNKKAGTMRLKNGQSDADTYSDSSDSSMLVSEIISSVKKGINNAEVVLASSLDAFKPEIREEIEIPTYCLDGKFFRSRIYIGPKGLVTTLHQDLPENLYAVVKGSKHITLYPPNHRKWLYANSVFSKHPNFSRFNPDHANYELFPLSRKAKPVEVYLQAGEMLYIPSLWWHHIRNTDDSIALNFWWSVGWKTFIAWAAAKYKQLIQNP